MSFFSKFIFSYYCNKNVKLAKQIKFLKQISTFSVLNQNTVFNYLYLHLRCYFGSLINNNYIQFKITYQQI